MSYVLQEYYAVPWRKLLRLRTLMTTSVKGSLLMKVKNNEENLFTSVLQDIEAQVTTMVIRAQSLSPLHRLHWFPSLPSCPGRSYISRKQFERDLVTDHELASRLVSPRTKSECGQEWLPALDTIYLHHVEYVPVMFKHSTNDMCFSTPWQRLEQPQNNGGAKVGLPQSPAIKENLTNKLTTSLLHRCLSTCVFVRLSHQKLKDE